MTQGDPIEARLRAAQALAAQGRDMEARDAYIALLADAPTHFGALNNLGALLVGMGFNAAARTAYAAAVQHHPRNPMGHVNLANALARIEDTGGARSHYAAALALDPAHVQAHQGLARLLAEAGEDDAAAHHRERGFRGHARLALPWRGAGDPRRVLVLASAAGGGVPIQAHLDDRVFAATVLYVEYDDPAAPLPPHELVFNSIGDADLCGPALDAAEAVLARGTARVLNPPAAIRPTGRAANARRLAAIPGVRTPAMAELPRAALEAPGAGAALAAAGLGFPLLLRAPGFHTGRHFLRVETLDGLPAALATLPGAALTAIAPLDARGPDGAHRKYRAMTVGGRLYPVHAAMSADWKVHYYTADMARDAGHRAEEARFLADMPGVLGPRAMAALQGVQAALGLDYGGIDFGLGADGSLLVFEANATMVVQAPDADPRWDYRRAPLQAVLDAVAALLRG